MCRSQVIEAWSIFTMQDQPNAMSLVIPRAGLSRAVASSTSTFRRAPPSRRSTIKGEPVSIERWVRLDALTNVVVQTGQQELQVEPKIRYIVSMVTEVYNLNERIGHKAERLEFESGGSAVTSTGHRCKSTGVLEELAKTAVS